MQLSPDWQALFSRISGSAAGAAKASPVAKKRVIMENFMFADSLGSVSLSDRVDAR